MSLDGKDQAKESVRATLTAMTQFLAQEAPPTLSEADTKANFIDPILAALGWTGIGTVVREYCVKNSQGSIDYVMRADGKAILAVEAKALQADLPEEAAAQLVHSCVVEGIEWAALTNGRELRLFNAHLKGDLSAKLLLRLDLLAFNSDAEYGDLFEQLWLLSRSSMTSPSGSRAWLEHRRMEQVLEAALFNPTSSSIKELCKYLEQHDIRASSEDVVAWFREQLVDYVLPTSHASTSRPATTPPPAARPVRAVGQSPNYYLLPAAKWQHKNPVDQLHAWLDRGLWGLHESTPCRKYLRAGDRACFYAARAGIVAAATITGEATTPLRDDEVPTGPPAQRLYRVPLGDVVWLPEPIKLDKALLARLDAFHDKPDPSAWNWIVQTTRRLTAHDFEILTGTSTPMTAAG